MPKLARLPANDRGTEANGLDAGSSRATRRRGRYFAFLSYSHQDEELADWLHRELEEFRVPPGLAGKLTANGVIPKRLTPIFRDQHELAAADDLGEEIREALASSQYLIVLCSPAAAASHWTNAEIETFKRTRPDGCVLAAIASGEPFASDMPGREAEECFPPALRQRFDRRGRPTGKRAEPLAADLREEEDKRLALLKLVAGMLGVGLDDLVQRETTRRQRRLAWLVAASLGGMAITSTLAITAIHARDAAREQRRQAEGLVAFMLGDLKDKLEPIGRLDALDGVGSRVLAYYSRQDTSELSDPALIQRARALSLMAEVANARGNLNESSRLYREAMAGTGEAVRRAPQDPQRLFDHAQNVFWVGDIARQRGDLAQAEKYLREYKDLADSMVRLQPDNLKWRMEVQYAEADLGVVFYYERRFAEATRQFGAALRTIEAVAAIDRNNGDYRQSLTDSLAWLADAAFSEGRIGDAIAFRQRQIAQLQAMSKASGDVRERVQIVPAQHALGQLLEASGDLPGAAQQLESAVALSDDLLAAEPSNTKWMNYAATAKLTLAGVLLATGRSADAAAQANSGCSTVSRLIAIDSTVVDFQTLLRTCLIAKTHIAISSRDFADAKHWAERAIALSKAIHSYDAGKDRSELVRSTRLLGDAEQGLGDSVAAQESWVAAGRLLPVNIPERPRELAERRRVLERVGRSADAREIASRLASMGYRRLEV